MASRSFATSCFTVANSSASDNVAAASRRVICITLSTIVVSRLSQVTVVTRRSTAEPRRKDRVASCVCKSRKRAWRSLCDEDTRPSRHARQRCQVLSKATRQDSERQSQGPRDRRGDDSLCRGHLDWRRGFFRGGSSHDLRTAVAGLSDPRRPPERQRRVGAAMKRPMDRALQDGIGRDGNRFGSSAHRTTAVWAVQADRTSPRRCPAASPFAVDRPSCQEPG